MTRSTWNPNAPLKAAGLEFLGVGSTGYGFPPTATVRQRGLRFRAQRTGQIDQLTLHLGPGTNVPTLPTNQPSFAGHRLPYVAELVPRDELDTGGPPTVTILNSSIVSTQFMVRSIAGAIQSTDLATQNGIGIKPQNIFANTIVHFPTASDFPLDRQITTVAIEFSMFSGGWRAFRLGDLNAAPVSAAAQWIRLIAGGTGTLHMGELWVELGDTAAWHQVTPQMVRQFDSAVGNRRMQLGVWAMNPNYIYDLFRLRVDHLPERRIGVGVIEAPSGGAAFQRDILLEIPLHAPGATGTPVDLVQGEEYVLVIRTAYAAASDYAGLSNLDVRALTDQKSRTGAVTHFTGLDWDWHDLTDYQFGPVRAGTRNLGTLLNGLPTVLLSNDDLPTVDSQPYLRTWPALVSQPSGVDERVVRQHNVVNPNLANEYRSFRFNVSIGASTLNPSLPPEDPLNVMFTLPGSDEPFLGPFSVTTEQVQALGQTLNTDEFGFQFHPVSVDFGEGVTFPALFDVVFTSVTSVNRPWRVAVLQARTETGGDETYGAGSATYAAPAPTVASSTTTAFAAPATTHNLNIPATVNPGDTLVAMGSWFGSVSTATPAGWELLGSAAVGDDPPVFVKTAIGNEDGGTVNLVTSGATAGAGMVIRLSGAHSDVLEACHLEGTISRGTSVEPNPPQANQPADWFTAPMRVLAIAAWFDDDVTLTGNPSGYTAGASVVSGAGANAGAGLGFAHRAVTAGSEDPGNFTLASSENWNGKTLLVRPAPSGGSLGSFATGFALDTVTGTVLPLNEETQDDLEFTLFTQAPEVTGVDVSVLEREAHGATCAQDQTAPTPEVLSESFNKVNGALGPDLTWDREVYDHGFQQTVVNQRVRYRVDEPGTWEDVQVPTPNFTGPDVRAQLTLTSLTVTGSPVTGGPQLDQYAAGTALVTRFQQTSEDDYRGYAAVVSRGRFFESPAEAWHLSLYRVDGRDDQVLIGGADPQPTAVAVTPNARWDRSTTGIVAPFTWCGWVRVDALPASFAGLAYFGGVGNNQFLQVFLQSDGSVRVSDDTFTPIVVGPTVTVGDWLFLAVSLAADDALTLHWRTESQPTLSSATGTFAGASVVDDFFYVASNRDTPSFNFTLTGAVSRYRVFSGQVLSGAQLTVESTADRVVHPVGASGGDWPFNETSGLDASGEANHLTLDAGTGSALTTLGPVLDPQQSGLVDTLPLAQVTLPGTLTVESVGGVHVARFVHAESGADLEVRAVDQTYQGGVTALRPRAVHALDGRVSQVEYDDFVLTQLAVGQCTTCVAPHVVYPRVCWAPSQLAVEDFAYFELQRREQGQEFETVEVLEKEDPSVTAVGATDSDDDPIVDHPAPSLAAVGDELLFCHWQAFQSGDYSVTGTDMRPLGTSLRLAGGAEVAVTPDRDLFNTSRLDVRLKLSLDDWTPGFLGEFLVGQWPNVAGQNSWVFSVDSAGTLTLTYSTTGSNSFTRTSTVPTGFTDGSVRYLRFTFVGNNGSGQNVTQFFTSVDGVTWTQLGATVTAAGAHALFNVAGPLQLGGVLPLVGNVWAVEVYNDVGGELLADPDFHSLVPGATALTDSVGNVWTWTGTVVATNELQGPNTPSIAAWEPVTAGPTGTRVAEIAPPRAWASQSVLVRGVEGAPVLEEVVTNLATSGGVTVGTSAAPRRGQWLLALVGTSAGNTNPATAFGPPTPGNWQLIADSGDTVSDRPRVAAWVRPVVDDGPQRVTFPVTNDPVNPRDYHLRVVVLSNVAEFTPSCYDDWSVAYGGEVCYRVRQGRSDGSVSDWSTEVCATVPAPQGVDLVITVPSRPELNAAYTEAHANLPTEREYNFLDADDTTYQAVYNRNNQLAFRPLEKRGVQFNRNLLVSPLCGAEVPCLEVVRPLRDLMTEPVPFVVVRDTCGNRWYASVLVPSAVQLATVGLPDLWTAQVRVTELAAPVIELPSGGEM